MLLSIAIDTIHYDIQLKIIYFHFFRALISSCKIEFHLNTQVLKAFRKYVQCIILFLLIEIFKNSEEKHTLYMGCLSSITWAT